MVATCVVTFAANERNTDGGASQKSDAHAAQ
jgi:hypothetical protein